VSNGARNLLGGISNEARFWNDLIDELRADDIDQYIQMPQIAVIGDQSSGKSSVLESLSGIPFPRGSGLTTVCAILLRMKHNPDTWAAAVYASAKSPAAAKHFTKKDTAAIGTHVSELAKELCAGATFSTESITIDLQSPDVPDLTVIDLPGIVRTTTKGQSRDVIEKVNTLLKSYMEQDRTIVLAVIPANQDIATVEVVEVVELCEQHDSEAARTISVLTKADLIDRGGEALVVDVLKNKTKPLTHGYHIVMNRSQEDIDNGTGLAEARAAETDYFAKHKVWGGAAVSALRKQIGMQHLSDKVTHVLVERIKTGVPDIIEEVDDELAAARSELALLGDALDGKPEASVMMRLVYTVCNDPLNAARGKYEGISMEDSDARLCTLVNAEFDDFKVAVLKTRPSCDDDSITAMQEELKECSGEEPLGFSRNYSYFKGKFASTVSEWGAQSELMLREVQTALSEVVEQEQLKRFTQLEILLLDTAQEVSIRLICYLLVAIIAIVPCYHCETVSFECLHRSQSD
jgi:interferon-induced GTP-binding protein Mx